MTKKIIILIVILFVGYLIYQLRAPREEILNFDDCVKAENPIIESYPRQCRANGITFVEEYCEAKEISVAVTLTDAQNIARNSECGDQFKSTYMCDAIAGIWWIDLNIEKEGCNPACAINLETLEAEIDWRCAGAIPE